MSQTTNLRRQAIGRVCQIRRLVAENPFQVAWVFFVMAWVIGLLRRILG